MSRVKVVKSEINQSGLNEMFQSILSGEGDETIVLEKYNTIISCIKTFVTVLNYFADSPFPTLFPEHKNWCEEFKTFANEIKTEILDKSDKWNYSGIKNHIIIRRIIMTCAELNEYDKFFLPGSDFTNSDKWITSMPGTSFKPFRFTNMDIKLLWDNDRTNAKVKSMMSTTISILFNKAKMIYDITNSPDVDVKKFASVIIESIDGIQTMPELNRCKDAFRKIKESVNMLEGNFGNYYKDMVDAKNPNLMIENFILDVSKKNEMKPELMRQFRTIISFYKKQSSTKVKDPNINKLFESLDSRMNKYDTKIQSENKN